MNKFAHIYLFAHINKHVILIKKGKPLKVNFSKLANNHHKQESYSKQENNELRSYQLNTIL